MVGQGDVEGGLELGLIEARESQTSTRGLKLCNGQPLVFLRLLIKVAAPVVSLEVTAQFSRERDKQFVFLVLVQRLHPGDGEETVLHLVVHRSDGKVLIVSQGLQGDLTERNVEILGVQSNHRDVVLSSF